MYPGGHACSTWPRGTHHKTKNNTNTSRLLGKLPLPHLRPIRHRTRGYEPKGEWRSPRTASGNAALPTFYPPCEQRHHFAGNPPVSEFLPSESVFCPQIKVYATLNVQLLVPRCWDRHAHRLVLHVANGRVERVIGGLDRPPSSPYIPLAFTQVESERKLANPIVFAFFVLLIQEAPKQVWWQHGLFLDCFSI